jgi:hypothetical protein
MTALVPVQNLRSGVANKRPVASGLAFGQIAVNYNADDPAIYLRGDGNELIKVAPTYISSGAPNAVPASGGASGNSFGETWLNISTTPPSWNVWDGAQWNAAYTLASGTVINDGLFVNAVLSGTTSAPTPASGNSSTSIATTAFVAGEIGSTIQGFDVDTAKTDLAQTFTAAQRGAVVALAGSGTVTPDFALANNFSMALSGTTTLAFPSGVASGQSGAIRIEQGNNFVVSYSGAWQFPNSTPPNNTVVSGAADLLVYYAHSTSGITAQLLPNVG